MTAFRNTVITVLVLGVLAGAAILFYRGVTQPDGMVFGIRNKAAFDIACWVLFAVLPLVVALDIVSIDQADWWAANHSKMAWMLASVTVPVAGVLLYAVLIRWRVAGAFSRWRNRRRVAI